MLDNELNHNGDVQLMNKPSSAITHPFSEMCSSASLVVPETPKDGVVVRVRIDFRVGGGWVEAFFKIISLKCSFINACSPVVGGGAWKYEGKVLKTTINSLFNLQYVLKEGV